MKSADWRFVLARFCATCWQLATGASKQRKCFAWRAAAGSLLLEHQPDQRLDLVELTGQNRAECLFHFGLKQLCVHPQKQKTCCKETDSLDNKHPGVSLKAVL